MTPATEQKAAAILAGGRLTVVEVTAGDVQAVCLGSAGQVYRLGLDAGGWGCSCAARRECSHLRALKLVTVWNLRRPA